MTIVNAKAEIDKLQNLDPALTQAIVIQVDKEVANYLLTRNFENNRETNPSRVLSYRKTMENGDWVLGDPIKLSTEGKLIDGQHRLKAASGLPDELSAPFVVLAGQPPKASETYDQGMTRNALHVSKIRGIEGISSSHISTIRMMFYFREGGREKTRGSLISPSKLIDILQKYPQIKEAVDLSFRHSYRLYGIRNAAIAGSIARAKISDYPLSDEDLDFFCHVLQGGTLSSYEKETRRTESAPLLLRNVYQSGCKGESGLSARQSLFMKTQSALQAFSQNKDIKILKGTSANLFPVPFIDSMNFKTLEFDPSIRK